MDLTGPGNGFGNSFAAADFVDNDAGASSGEFLHMLGGLKVEMLIENLYESVMNVIEDGEIETSEKLIALRRKFIEFSSRGYFMSVGRLLKPLEETRASVHMNEVLEALSRYDFNPSSQAHFRGLAIDISGSVNEFGDLESRLCDLSERYMVVYNELFAIDKEIKNCAENFAVLVKKIDDFVLLEQNSASIEMYRAFTNYMMVFFNESDLKGKFDKFVKIYREFTQIRKLLKIKDVAEGEPQLPLCSICISHSVIYTLNPCGHTFCSSCAMKQNSHCFICRTKMIGRLKLFFS
jgi:Zinc finger, C3HC4 type (RING finger)